MASISTEPGGRRTIQFVGADGKRRSIRLGKVSQRAAEGVQVRVEAILAAKLTGHPLDGETARWVGALDGKLAEKLARVGLIPGRKQAAVTLGQFTASYIDGRSDVKRRTTAHLQYAARMLVAFFGEDRSIGSISLGDAEEYRRWLIAKGWAENTIRRHCGRAKQFFRFALRKRLIQENPFGDMSGLTVRENRERDFFVTPDMAAAILDACPDAEWRLLFALSRFGGLRCPSEHLALKWSDVDWERQRLRITSSKTEHCGKGKRWIPVFPELKPHLDAVREQAETGSEYVIGRCRDTNVNLRTQLYRIIRRAGLEPWPKLFQNLRSSRETELAQSFPLHVVCAWIGNSQPVAMKHYLQVTDEHFASALQNPVQYAHVSGRNAMQTETAEVRESLICSGLPSVTDDCTGVGCPLSDSNRRPTD